MLAHWANEARAAIDRLPDPALVQAGLELVAELPATAEQLVVLFTDLHAGNVLRAERAPWLAIDPKPFVGDPAYDSTQHLFNCLDRVQTAPIATIASVADQHRRSKLFVNASGTGRTDRPRRCRTGS
ncbi:MAG TPA: aminoglycoside phosphotransferase family protein [Gemmatimonadaceae bacterium]